MQKTKKGTGQITILPSCCIGTGAGLVITLAAAAIGAVFISNEYVALETVGVLGALIQFLSLLSGAVLAGIIMKEDKILCCIAVAVAYYTIMICVGMLFFEGISGKALTGMLACTAGCVVSILLSARRKNHAVHRKNKRSYR